MAQAATHPTAAVLGSPANSLGSPLSQFLSHRTKNHPANQKLRQSLSVNATRPSGSFVTFQATASVILAVGSRAQRLQTASFVPLSTICSHYPNAGSRLFYLRTVPYYQQFVIREGKEKIKKENPHYNNTPSHKKPPFKPLRPS